MRKRSFTETSGCGRCTKYDIITQVKDSLTSHAPLPKLQDVDDMITHGKDSLTHPSMERVESVDIKQFQSCHCLYSPVTFLITGFLLSSGLQLQWGDQLRTKEFSGRAETQVHSTQENATSELILRVFEDSSREPNQWKIFSRWSCNNPEAKTAYQSSLYTKKKANGDTSLGIIVFGGRLPESGQDPYYGTWYYDVQEKLWQSVRTSSVPQNRKGHFMVTLCHTTVVMMGGYVQGTTNFNVRLVNDVWIISDRLGTWKEVMKDCNENSCLSSRPTLSSDSTARTVAQPSSDCQCKESVLVFVSASVVWELLCLRDEESYIWLKFYTKAKTNRRFDIRDQLTASDVLKGVVYGITDDGVWQYFHQTGNWSLLQLKHDNQSSLSNDSDIWYPSTQDLGLVDHSLFWEDDGQLVLIGNALSRVLVFNPANQRWKAEAVVGTPPYVRGYLASVIQATTILAYGGTNGGCVQRVWTLRRSGTWYWAQIPTSAVEPEDIMPRAVTALLGSRLYIQAHVPKPNPNNRGQLWELDLNSMQWWQLRVDNGPPLLYGGWMTTTADQSAIIMAGATNRTYFGTWMFSPSSGEWTAVDSPTDLRDKQMHSFVRYNDTDFILFGGLEHIPGRRVVVNEVWRFRLNLSYPCSSQWQLVAPYKPNLSENDPLKPSPRYLHSAVVINSSMVVFGGQSESRHCLHDVWALDLDNDIYTWNLVTNNSNGPRPTKRNYCYSSTVALGPHLLVTTGCNPSFSQSHSVECDTANLMQTWLYLPHVGKWSFVAWIRQINARLQNVMFLFRDYVVLPGDEGRFQLQYLSPQCPNGLFSPDMKAFPCLPCPIGQFTAQSRDRCEKCPDGLTTPTKGSATIFNCSVSTETVTFTKWTADRLQYVSVSPVSLAPAALFPHTTSSLCPFSLLSFSLFAVLVRFFV